MKTCIYDNPEKWCREYYKDGKLTGWTTIAAAVSISPRKGYPHQPWQPGRIIGDPEAMGEDRKKAAG